jgi:hypothetical protein
MDHLTMRHWRFFRSCRQATGTELEPLRKSLSFLPTNTGSILPIVSLVALAALLIVSGGV